MCPADDTCSHSFKAEGGTCISGIWRERRDGDTISKIKEVKLRRMKVKKYLSKYNLSNYGLLRFKLDLVEDQHGGLMLKMQESITEKRVR